MSRNYFESGSWNVICDSCGKRIKSKHARHRWDGFIVCDGCFEHRHPQDFIKVKPEKQSVAFSRRPSDIFIDVTYITNYVAVGYIDDDYFEDVDI